MQKIESVMRAVKYIDEHYTEELDFKKVASKFYISPYYFHRIFSSIIGMTVTEYIKERRLYEAGIYLSTTNKSIIDICYECGFRSSQSFTRTFKNFFQMSPSRYRKLGEIPVFISVNNRISQFKKNIEGGINVEPRIIERGDLIIAGVTGNGSETHKLWEEFETLISKIDIENKKTEDCYEIRFYGENIDQCHIGYEVSSIDNIDRYSFMELPASKYAAFEIYVSKGYDSSNEAIDKWLEDNKNKYIEILAKDGSNYAIEFYDDRFQGEDEESIVELWIPIKEIS